MAKFFSFFNVQALRLIFRDYTPEAPRKTVGFTMLRSRWLNLKTPPLEVSHDRNATVCLHNSFVPRSFLRAKGAKE
ncbi:MAG: hypothetical protein ACK5VW_05715 [Holosporales bacterium]